jgi:membrane glycosyltransferase
VDGADWARAIRTHAWQLLTGLLWGAIAWRIHPAFFWWMSPVLGSLLFAIPFSAMLSLPFITSALPRWGLFATPQETAVPPEIVQLEWNISALHRRAPPPRPLREDYGFMQAVLDPLVNAVHVSLSRQQHKHRADPGGHYLLLEEKVLRDGPGVLTPREKRALLLHPGSMARLHRAIWMLPDSRLSPWWTLAMRQYNTLTHHPHTALYR